MGEASEGDPELDMEDLMLDQLPNVLDAMSQALGEDRRPMSPREMADKISARGSYPSTDIPRMAVVVQFVIRNKQAEMQAAGQTFFVSL